MLSIFKIDVLWTFLELGTINVQYNTNTTVEHCETP